MRVFFDTEFTGLNSDPHLLSIGMVSADGHELYFEFADGWTEDQCSPWVRANVLPLLGAGERLSRREGTQRILMWLSELGTAPTLVGDSDWDTELLSELLGEAKFTSHGYRLELLKFEGREQAGQFDAAKKQYFSRHSVRPHNALTDAKAFRAAYYAVFESGGTSPEPTHARTKAMG